MDFIEYVFMGFVDTSFTSLLIVFPMALFVGTNNLENIDLDHCFKIVCSTLIIVCFYLWIIGAKVLVG